MKAFQALQNRAAQTAAVIRQYVPAFAVGGVSVAELLAESLALDALAQARDDALAAWATARAGERQGLARLQALTMALPKVAAGELDARISGEADLLALLFPVYAIAPRTSELALERGKRLVAALNRIDEHFAALPVARAPITSAGRGVAELLAAMAELPVLAQAAADRGAEVTAARAALRGAAKDLDRQNKRFYIKLKAEARSQPDLLQALAQITTESAERPAILAIRSIRQGGTDDRQLLLRYAAFDRAAANSVEWRVVTSAMSAMSATPATPGEKSRTFPHSVAADPAGNAIGPFASGQTVQLRTRVRKANGSNTGSVRTLTIA